MRHRLLAVSFLSAATALSAMGQDYTEPGLVGINRMEPSGLVLPYPSADAALAGDLSQTSDYIVPLTEWSVSRNGRATELTTRFKVPYTWSDRLVILRMEQVPDSFTVEVNGQQAGYSQIGSGRIQFDLTKLCVENYNDLRVTLVGNSSVLAVESPRDRDGSDFGRAWIVSQPKVRIRDLYVESRYENGNGLFNLGVAMESSLLNPKDYDIMYELYSPQGERIAWGERALRTQMLSRDSVYFFSRIPDISPWTHETPVLYTLLVKTRYEGRYKEYVSQKVGFTSSGFGPDGSFSVSGEPVVLSPAPASWRGSEEETSSLLESLRAQGHNMVMVEAHPQIDEFYSMCDRMGMYVCDVADIDTSSSLPGRRVGENPSNDPAWSDSFSDRARVMYLSSKNHPSVVAFSLSGTDSSNGIAMYDAYVTLKELERGRPVLYEAAAGEWNSDKVSMDPSASVALRGIETVTECAAAGEISLRNSSAISSYRVRVSYSVRRGPIKMAEGSVEVTVAPGRTEVCPIPTGRIKPGKKNVITVTLYDMDRPGETLSSEMSFPFMTQKK